MKKFLPLVILLAGTAVLVGAFLFLKGGKNAETTTKEEKVSVIPADKMPTISLLKSDDGHYLTLKVERLDLLSPSKIDYELLYEVPGKEQPQGTGSGVDVSGKNIFEAELLLGTESSGKFRYDEKVEKGVLTLKFRDDKGRLIGRTKTEFDLASDKVETTSF